MGRIVIGGALFRRFMLRFVIGLGVAFLLFAPLVHLFQKRVVDAEWSKDLRQEAIWAARHMKPDMEERYAKAWRTMHNTVRVTFFDPDGELLHDSHPERPVPELLALRRGEVSAGHLAAVEKMKNGGWLMVSRPWIPGFPYGMHWELVLAAVLVVVVAYLLLYPLVRTISTTLGELGELAVQVSSGHFGKTLSVERSDELGSLVGAFNDMSSKLAEAEKLNSRLLHDVSHELRSPLGRIQALAETSVHRPEEADECVLGIGQEVALLERLVDDLLSVARIESDSIASHFETFSLFEWAGEIDRRLARNAGARGIGWTTSLSGADRNVRGDWQRLAQAVGNLVDNAIYALEGQEDARIELTVSATDDSFVVTVADNGPGIPAGDLPHVFRRFYRVGDDRDRDRGGVGLGLSLVQAITRAHGGRATIESRTGASPELSTRVTLTLPCR